MILFTLPCFLGVILVGICSAQWYICAGTLEVIYWMVSRTHPLLIGGSVAIPFMTLLPSYFTDPLLTLFGI